MFPFASLPGQTHLQATSDLSLQQMHFPSPPVPNSGIHNTDNAGNVAAASAIPYTVAPFNCPNLPPVMQNNQMGLLHLQQLQLAAAQTLNQQSLALQLLGQSCGALGNLQQLQGQLQSPSNISLPQPGYSTFSLNNLPQNFNLMGGMSNGRSLPLNMPMMQQNHMRALNFPASVCSSSSNSEPMGNNHLVAVGNLNTSFGNVTLCQPICPTNNHITIKEDKQLEDLQLQAHCIEVVGRVIEPESCPGKRYNRTDRKSKRTELRVQKQQFQNSKSMKTNTRCFRIKYTEEEVQQWIEARRRNFPTRTKIEKLAQRGVNSEDTDGNSKLRQQQVKKL
ncbi:hypothetical protein Cni_G12597 [Canna indica]|uniref:FMR1-interacting protein 1 conserved domain-containing protein n=1 Tax=Canna indica TaxID=4628 RepID=A0AAQ3K844_9LILI|nr:hypothetical protein Cni_G12597 [Canna indica]